MLALANKEGVVQCTIPGLADRARISLEECEKALERFKQPDKYSWSRECEGRRIQDVDGGWFLINHAKFREMLSVDEQREKTRIRVERWRKKHSQALPTVTPVTKHESNDIASTTTKTLNPPNPPFSKPEKGGNGLRKLTPREFKKISAEAQKIQAASVGRDIPPEEVLATACARAGVEFERAKHLLEQS